MHGGVLFLSKLSNAFLKGAGAGVGWEHPGFEVNFGFSRCLRVP
jgi:hypothetical protein